MKKLLLITLIVASFGLGAQELPEISNDSISVMFQNLKNTNEYVVDINNSLRTHTQLIAASFLFEAAGAACFYYASQDNTSNKQRQTFNGIGGFSCVVGGVMFLCSYIPIWKKELTVDERGLVVRIPISK